MKSLLILFVLFFLIQSCTSEHSMATQLCDCYTQLHRANNESDINFWTDSCNQLYIDIVNDLEKNPAEKEVFKKAYRSCQ